MERRLFYIGCQNLLTLVLSYILILSHKSCIVLARCPIGPAGPFDHISYMTFVQTATHYMGQIVLLTFPILFFFQNFAFIVDISLAPLVPFVLSPTIYGQKGSFRTPVSWFSVGNQ